MPPSSPRVEHLDGRLGYGSPGWFCVSTDPFPCPAAGCVFVAEFMTAAHLVLVWEDRDDPNLLRHAQRAKDVGRNPHVVEYEPDFGPSASGPSWEASGRPVHGVRGLAGRPLLRRLDSAVRRARWRAVLACAIASRARSSNLKGGYADRAGAEPEQLLLDVDAETDDGLRSSTREARRLAPARRRRPRRLRRRAGRPGSDRPRPASGARLHPRGAKPERS